MTELDELLREYREATPRDDAIEREALDHARRTLRAAAGAKRPLAVRRRLTPRVGRFGLVAALTATIAAVVALLPGGTGTHTSQLGPATASAQTLLRHAAQAISRYPWQPLRPGQYLHFRQVESYPDHNGPAPPRPTMVQDIWLGANGYARIVQTGPNTVIPGGDVLILHATPQQLQAERQRQQRGVHLRILAYAQKYRWGPALDYQQLLHLPTNPDKLRRWIEHKAINPGSTCAQGASDCNVFNFVESLLMGGPLPPKLTATLYRVIATLPGMRLIGPVHDPLGRPGMAVGYFFSHQPGRIELIFDPATGALLGERDVSLDATRMHAPAGAVTGWRVIERQGIVNSDHHD